MSEETRDNGLLFGQINTTKADSNRSRKGEIKGGPYPPPDHFSRSGVILLFEKTQDVLEAVYWVGEARSQKSYYDPLPQSDRRDFGEIQNRKILPFKFLFVSLCLI